jgi:hypothetical protein
MLKQLHLCFTRSANTKSTGLQISFPFYFDFYLVTNIFIGGNKRERPLMTFDFRVKVSKGLKMTHQNMLKIVGHGR